MRIIAGDLGGRKIHPPAKMPYTRPTTDVAKEGLFNVLQHRISFDGIKTLDLFGGTGSISYELASRGAADLTIVEKDNAMFAFIKKTAAFLKIENMKFVKMDVFKYLETCSIAYDFIFAGPPYALATIDELPRIIIEKQLLKENGWFVLEHTPRNDYKPFEKYSFEKNYGTTIFSVFINRPV
ncbi:RsmD family RNA methyltransferase [Niabella aurantiaca]|uniref:RsmD family RNA methyltransferase n=1 Tax=Niabella aurantiaca TaxID=379900 RepID=UPI0003739533|nr:RsmD family RNA methyltransferase [Niabella aurantiaca]